MSEKNIFADREHWLEEEYFRKQEQELIEKIHQRQFREADRQRLAEITGLKDDDALAALQDLGYSSETVELLHMLPLVEVAWASGAITDKHRNAITKIARMRGIAEDSESDQRLMQWLAEKPSEQLFETSLRATRLMLEALPTEEQEHSRKDLLLHCNQIAHALYGRLWGHEVIHEEEQMIAHIAEELGWKQKH
ncbi:MAG TPA: hypothetical protein PLK30_14070 [Blastocatellia bacterium]|nr:hypothetical protein [Blastocatellia bacterium]